jgi:maltooligosyltrehalose trehalohydrolase
METLKNIVTERTLGINFINGRAHINLWSPLAQKITFEPADKPPILLQQGKWGYWNGISDDIKPGDRYKFNIDGKMSLPDPASLSQPDGVHQASECLDLNLIRKTSHTTDWKGIKTHDLVLYELHTGTFTPQGTFAGIESKIDYLKNLGITAINIMPVASFPGKRNWGYDLAFPFSVHQAYGGAEALARLVRICHEKNMAVVLDVIYNHMGPEGNYLGAYGPYFTDKYKTPWGNAINFDDAWSDGVRHYFLENALMWLRDFHIDGLRLDAVHAIKDFGPRHFLRELAENVEELNRQTHSSHFLIAEVDLNDTRFIKPLKQDGFGMDAQWCDEWHHAIHALLTGEKSGYYSDFGKIEHLSSSYNNAYVFTGQYSQHRKKSFGTPTDDFGGDKFVVFIQNHDHTGNRMMGERLSQLIDLESLKLAAGAMIFSPFIPLLFMGEEYAEDSPFLYFVDHGDKDLIEGVREGRKNEFRDFIGDQDPPDPADEATFLQSKLKWDFERHDHKTSMLDYYKEIISIRKKFTMLLPGDRRRFSARHTTDIIVLSYKAPTETIVVVLNFSRSNEIIEVEELHYDDPRLILYSAHKQWAGHILMSQYPLKETQNNRILEIAARSLMVFHIKNPENRLQNRDK